MHVQQLCSIHIDRPVLYFHSLSFHFNGHFPGEPELAGVYWSKGWRRWWWRPDYWSYKSCNAPVKSSPPTNQHRVFFTGQMPFLSPNQQCLSIEGKISHSMDLLIPSSPAGLPTLSLTIKFPPFRLSASVSWCCHKKRRGEQLKWSLAFRLYIGRFPCAQLPGSLHTARLGRVFFCVFSLGLCFVYSLVFLWFVWMTPILLCFLGQLSHLPYSFWR